MPRETLNLDLKVDYLSILDPDGNVDQDLDPGLDEDLLRRMHRTMLLGRRFDERMLKLHGSGRLGTFAPIQGQEASQVGAAAALGPDDWLVPSFRELAAEIWHGKPLVNVLLVYDGYNEGGRLPEGVRLMPVAIPVGTQTLHAVGLAYAAQYRETDSASMVFFGDGATSEGDFHEALNFAGVLTAPVVFVCQNNQYAISIPRRRQTKSETLAQKALAYGLPGIQVDGNDVLAVHQAAREAVDRARRGQGATLIECVTYRMNVHTTADDPSKYRPDEEVEEWRQKDPITRFQTYLKNKNLLDDDRIEALEKEIQDQIQDAVDEWEDKEAEYQDPSIMFDHVYHEPPPRLVEQRDWFQRWRQQKGGE